MTTGKTYTAEFKCQAVRLAACEDVGPIRAAGCFSRSGSSDPDPIRTGNSETSERERNPETGA